MADVVDARRVRAVIRGDVQGVGFRYFVQHRGRQAGLHGFVRNLPDGAVEVEAEGAVAALERFVGVLRQGPRLARVDDVSVTWLSYRGNLPAFSVRF